MSLTLLPAVGTLFILLGCLVQLQGEGSGPCLALLYFVFVLFGCFLL